MMKFKEYILAEAAFEDKKLQEIIKNVDPTYLKNFLNDSDGNKIFRGRGEHGHVAIHDHPKNRVSANTTNEFTLSVDNFLPSWESFPKRSQSFICATSADIAENYGYVYRVLPFGNPEIGVCPDADIWTSFDKIDAKYSYEGNSVVQGYNNALNQISNLLFHNDENFESVSKLRNLFMKIDKLIKKQDPEIDKVIKKLIQDYGARSSRPSNPDEPYTKEQNFPIGELAGQILILAKQEKSIISAIDKMWNTKINGFEKMLPNQLFNAGVQYDEREVWLSSKCAFILESSVTLYQGRIKFLMGK